MAKKTQPESVVSDRTAIRQNFWTRISVEITNATQLGVPRVAVIEDLLRAAENLRVVAKEHDEDLSALEGLLS